MKKSIDSGLFISRIAIGFPMLLYGISKVQSGVGFIENLLVEKGLPAFLAYGVYAGEVVAPILIILGFRARLAGLIFALNCLTAIGLAQSTFLFMLNDYGGWALELLAMYMLIGISLLCTGAGKIAVSSQHPWD